MEPSKNEQQSINIEDLIRNFGKEISQLQVDKIMLKTQLDTVLKRNEELEKEKSKS